MNGIKRLIYSVIGLLLGMLVYELLGIILWG